MTYSLTPWTTGELLRDQINRIFDHALTRQSASGEGSEEVSTRTWSPLVDVSEGSDALILEVELPGIDRNEVNITVENNSLSIRGERRFEKSEDDNYVRIERAYGPFSRSFTLPSNYNTDAVEANYADGVLTVRVPKAEEAKPRRIKIV